MKPREHASWMTIVFVVLGMGGSSSALGETGHPGNVHLVGDEVIVRKTESLSSVAKRWRALDDALNVVAVGECRPSERRVRIGELGIGWYRVEFQNEGGKLLDWTSAAVLAPRAKAAPKDSPVCLDVALSWVRTERPTDLQVLARLARLAGGSWVRDRLRWREIQPTSGPFVAETKYDALAKLQVEQGLKMLQTFHGTPKWAVSPRETTAHFPGDLRVAYEFCKRLAERFKGSVQAWEPWNEANAHNFGGHTIDEMCSYQKAAYLGFKAGDPAVTVCWNPIGGINTPALAKGILENETWPYYERYCIHSYDWPHDYAKLWEPARRAACGRPIWVTECDRGMRANKDSPRGDFTHGMGRRKAQFMAHAYASSLHAGAERHFHFILRQYMEGEHKVQFGLVRSDLTPRISYVALAALGRMLAGGRCLGRWAVEGCPNAYVIAFRARPDGKPRDVLVAWAEERVDWPGRGKASVPWSFPKGLNVLEVFDYLGRSLGQRIPDRLTSASVFVVLPQGETESLELTLPERSAFRKGSRYPIVLQLQMPPGTTIMRKEAWTPEHERTATPGKPTPMTVVAYNFTSGDVEGDIRVARLPRGWRLTPRRAHVALGPMGRQEVPLQLMTREADGNAEADRWVKICGDFGKGLEPALAFRVLPRREE